MPDRIHRILGIVAIALLPFAAYAQDERWYRVELIIFKHLPGDYSETFAATPVLTYPDEFRFLIDPDRVAFNAEQNPGISQVTAYGRQIIESEAATDTDDQAALAEPVAAQSGALESEQAEVTPAEPLDTGLPLAFQLLPQSAREFAGKAAYMQRSGRYKILFHRTWVQPVVSERAALPIVLDHSGDDEAWPELQGYIKLYLSRYLHLETNLWLNTQGQYLGNNNWQMPAPPWAPPSLIIEAPPEQELTEPGDPDAELPLVLTGEGAADLTATDGAEEELLQPVYPWRHAVLLRQKRRMRSQEIHYIDHPLLGVVARLMPVSEEELEALSSANAAADGADR